jgi:Zn-dependent protease
VALLACPSCQALVHADLLKSLAAQAARAERDGNLEQTLMLWNRMLTLLPPGSAQHSRISQMAADMSARVAPAASGPLAAKTAAARPGAKKRAGAFAALGAVGVLLLKFKWALLFLLGKGKLILLGLMQAKTFLSMALALGVYAMAWGWKFAAGLIVSLYLHEMGHVAWLRHYGLAATAPMFIPGVGAFVRLRQPPRSPAEDARIGMAGPMWGALAAVGFLVMGRAMQWPAWNAIAAVGAWINIFNLLPVWQLDGGRAWNALARSQRGWTAALLWGLALLTSDGLFFILAIAGTLRAWSGKAPEKADPGAFWMHAGLAVGLTVIMLAARSAIP